jgi:hypothetical protein
VVLFSDGEGVIEGKLLPVTSDAGMVELSETVGVADGMDEPLPVTSDCAIVEFADCIGMPVDSTTCPVPVGRYVVEFADVRENEPFLLPNSSVKFPDGAGMSLDAVPIGKVMFEEAVGTLAEGTKRPVESTTEEFVDGTGTALEPVPTGIVEFAETAGIVNEAVELLEGVGIALDPVPANDVKLSNDDEVS